MLTSLNWPPVLSPFIEKSLYQVNSNSNHCLFSELPSAYTRVRQTWAATAAHWSLKYQGIERPNLLGLSCRLRSECGMTFPTLCLTPERWIGSRVQSTAGCFPELCFLFSWAGVGGLQKQLVNNLVFPFGPVQLVLIIKIRILSNHFSNVINLLAIFSNKV